LPHNKNKPLEIRPFVQLGALWVIVLLLLSACRGLAGEPEIVATLPPPPTPLPETGYPLELPDLARGAQLFAQHCTQCHGEMGRGDGPLVASGELPTPPTDFTDPATANSQRPIEWYNTITNGRIENLMPPWRDTLSEAERWAVAMYTYTMWYTPDWLTLGQETWAANCARCHGETGRGDGPDAADINRPVGDMTIQSEVVAISDNSLFNIVTEGSGENMPAFADELSVEQRWAVVSYARTLSLANANVIGSQPQPVGTEDVGASSPSTVGTVTGLITNGTVDGEVPPNLTVTLHSLNADFTSDDTLETTIAPDGSFTFDNVGIANGRTYVATVAYRDRIFGSDSMPGDPANPVLEMPITIYELTEDPEVISISRMAIQVDAIGEGLQVTQAIIFNNTSDRVYTNSQSVAEGRYASVVMSLPPGAVVVGFGDTEQRYIVLEEESAVIDTVPVVPGEDHVNLIVYFVPYEDGAIIEHPINYALDGEVRLLVNPPTVSAISEQLPPLGPANVGNRTYDSYGADLTLASGDVVRYELRGQGAPGGADVTVTQAPASSNLLPVILLILGGGAILVAGVLYLRSRGEQSVSKDHIMDTLIREIADLDARHEAGQINHDLYQRQRTQLKARLAELMEEEK
jgi:mono/diheme cytochrome c family protein